MIQLAITIVLVTCAAYSAIAERLSEKFGERRVAGGIMGESVVFEWWQDDQDGSWTLLQLRPIPGTMLGCIVAAGQNARHWPLPETKKEPAL